MAGLRHRRALEARLDKLERTVSAALAQRAPKPQDRASAQALIRKHMAETLDALIRGEQEPRPPEGYDAAEDLLGNDNDAAEAAKIRAELNHRAEQIEEAERQQVVRDFKNNPQGQRQARPPGSASDAMAPRSTS